MNIDLQKTLKILEKRLTSENCPTIIDLYRAYDLSIRLRSQLLGIIYERETFGYAGTKPGTQKLAQLLTEGNVGDNTVTLSIHEPLPPLKELTSALQDHWLDLVHTAIAKAAEKQSLPRFEKAFVWIEVTTPKGTDNAKLWDTSNRAVNLIINNLKGIFFEDDNLEHMAFGVVGKWGEKGVTIVHILPFNRLDQIMTTNP